MQDDAVQMLLAHAERAPERPLLTCSGRTFTYADFLARAGDLVRELRAAGLEPGQRVALFLEDYERFFLAMFAVWMAGGVVLPLNTTLPPADVEWLIGKARPSLLLIPDEGALTAGGPSDRGGAATGGAGAPCRLVVGPPGETPPGPLPDLTPVRADDLAMILFTSGTTGVPKGVCQTLTAVTGNAALVSQALALNADDRIFINTPPYFTSGICHFLTLMAGGGSMVGHAGFFFGSGLLDEMAALGCTGFGGAPAHLVRVVEPLDGARRPGALRFWVSSGDHLPTKVIEKAECVLPGVSLFNMYGLTEVSGRLCIMPPDELHRREGSVGRPIGAMRVTVRDDGGDEVRAGDTGELFVDGPLVMRGYLDEPEITARTLTPHGLRTGDFGHRDKDGFVWIAGRKDDIFKRGGEKVSAIHIQQALLGLGMFADAAVVPVDDEILGQVPVAFVVPLDGVEYRRGAVMRGLKATLPATSLPSRIVPLAEIPRTGSGKVIRGDLLALASTH